MEGEGSIRKLSMLLVDDKPDDSEDRRATVELKNVSKTFIVGENKIEALKDINLEFFSTDFTIVYGPSGCGKSTLLNVICGLEEPTEGHVEVRNTNMYALDENERAVFRAKKFGIVHQQPYWVKSLNVLENIAVPLFAQGYDYEDGCFRAMEVLKKVGLQKHYNHIPTELSGGQQQRVALARAIVTNPWIIVADEPTGNLDSKSAEEVMSIFMELNIVSKRTVIMVTHNLAYLTRATRVVEMKDGAVLRTKLVDRVDELTKNIKPKKTRRKR